MFSYDGLIEAAGPGNHTVQLYGSDTGLLARSAGRYFRQAFDAGKALVIVAGASHLELFARDFTQTQRRHAVFLDADEMLDRILTGDKPDAEAFRRHVALPIEQLAAANPHGVRAYGEMVGILWAAGRRETAIALEELWNRLLRTVNFELYCAYPIDVFEPDFDIASVDEIMCTHSHLRPVRNNADLLHALHRAMDRILGSRAEQIVPLIRANYRPAWGAMQAGEALILWLRNNLPAEAETIIAAARVDFLKSAGQPA